MRSATSAERRKGAECHDGQLVTRVGPNKNVQTWQWRLPLNRRARNLKKRREGRRLAEEIQSPDSRHSLKYSTSDECRTVVSAACAMSATNAPSWSTSRKPTHRPSQNCIWEGSIRSPRAASTRISVSAALRAAARPGTRAFKSSKRNNCVSALVILMPRA